MLDFMPLIALRSYALPVLNDSRWLPVLLNKWLFHLHFTQFGIPLPEVYGVYEPGAGFTRSGGRLASRDDLRAFLMQERPASLVAKPVGGMRGQRILILDGISYDGDQINAVTNTEEHLTIAALADFLDRPPKLLLYLIGGYELDMDGYLLQAKLRQHDALEQIAPWTTNTVRVVTFRDRDDDIDIHFTILRLGCRGIATDNCDAGGISVAVDPATGRLGRGLLKPKHGGQWMEVHPDSEVRFTGRTIPFWDEVIATCKRAASVAPNLLWIGWDVAITPDGPVVIEANPDWDLTMARVHSNGLLQPPVRAKLARFGLTFPEGELPPLSLRAWSKRLKERRRLAVHGRRG